MPEKISGSLPAGAVAAALNAAQALGCDVADVPIAVIAKYCGMSRSTFLRRLGGSREPLDEAVRALGVDPGGVPVRIRAVSAAAALISENGLAAATFDAIATRAECSVPSLFAAFKTRDGLLCAVFERYSPIDDFEEFFAQPNNDLRQTVGGLYNLMIRTLNREPRVVPAIFAEAFARPSSPAVHTIFSHALPRMSQLIGGWLGAEVSSGRIQNLPIVLIMQQLMSPMLMHLLARPVAQNTIGALLPDLDTASQVFADAFVNAVGIPPTRQARR